ncbi:MAG: hypothetical protein ACR2MT_18025 [Aurantibacter sp.]
MFSTGQLIFAVLFAIVFTVVIWLAYRGDRRLHSKNYKGVKWVALTFLLFITALFVLKYLLK